MLRELSFSAGALALAASLTANSREHLARILATIARYFIAVAVLFYSFEQFRHADHVPGIPLEKITPAYVFGHAFWTYLAAALYIVPGILLLIGKKTRLAAAWVGLTVLFVVLIVYIPIAVAERASLEGLNYLADTLMFSGAVLLLARAMPRQAPPATPAAEPFTWVACVPTQNRQSRGFKSASIVLVYSNPMTFARRIPRRS